MNKEIRHLIEFSRVGNEVDLEHLEDYINKLEKDLEMAKRINVEDLPLANQLQRRGYAN